MTDRLSLDELSHIIRDTEKRLGWVRRAGAKRWRHVQSGNLYDIRGVTLRESDVKPLVAYSPKDRLDVVFSRPIIQFLNKFELAE